MNALNTIETTTNTLPSVNWELQDELNDADLMAICGGTGGSLISLLNGKNALKEGILNNANLGDLDVVDNKGGSVNVDVL